MPLIFANIGEENIIKKVSGSPQIKKHLGDLGFVTGASVTVISSLAGNLIVNIRECRVALNSDMARKIMIQ